VRVALCFEMTCFLQGDRVREALFSSLESLYGGHLGKLRFADLYAGSGAIGLEALSRGAAYALFVEADPKTARVIRANIGTLKVMNQCDVAVVKAATAVATAPAGGPFDVVFADPPYAVTDEELAAVLEGLAVNGWLADDATVVVERSRRSAEPPWVQPVTADRSRKYGETTLWYGRAARTRAHGEHGGPSADEQGIHQAEGMAQ
jgi:16S rRNA (guanine(966)-N(2))-methyltransferase RsmD